MKGPLILTQPLDIDDAREAAREMSSQRRATEEMLKGQNIIAADAEANYRRAFAAAFVRAEGTAAERQAVAHSESADMARDRDIQERMFKVFEQRLRGLEGERAMLRALMEWSMKLNVVGVE